MSTSTPPQAPTVRNGVPVDKLFGTIGKLKEQPELAKFEFTSTTTWIDGTASESSTDKWYGAGALNDHVQTFSMKADHPTLGHGHGPTPQEYVLQALSACVTAGIATTAAARKIELSTIETTIKGAIDVQGVLGIDPDVRNGFNQIDLEVQVTGDASAEDLAALVEASRKRSAVYDIVTNPTNVNIEVKA